VNFFNASINVLITLLILLLLYWTTSRGWLEWRQMNLCLCVQDCDSSDGMATKQFLITW